MVARRVACGGHTHIIILNLIFKVARLSNGYSIISAILKIELSNYHVSMTIFNLGLVYQRPVMFKNKRVNGFTFVSAPKTIGVMRPLSVATATLTSTLLYL